MTISNETMTNNVCHIETDTSDEEVTNIKTVNDHYPNCPTIILTTLMSHDPAPIAKRQHVTICDSMVILVPYTKD